MTDEPALRRAIIDAPADDGSRLVYADWLDENGSPGYADFIRLSIAGEFRRGQRLAVRRWFNPWWDGPSVYRRRENGRVMVVRVRAPEANAHQDEIWVRRGFVDELWLPTAAFLAHAAALFAAHPIVSVRLTDRGPDRSRLVYNVGATPYCWFNEKRWGGPSDPACLPRPIFECLANDIGDGFSGVRDYETSQDALAALSAACVAFGRRAAGLSDLPAPLAAAWPSEWLLR